ncbi:MAG: hypothetical protein Q9212_004437 [Teloschistes hypoglaucus]
MDSNTQSDNQTFFKHILRKFRHLIRRPRKSDGASLHTLPPELFMVITDFLPPRDIISLSHTCRKFYHHSPLRIEDLFDRFPSTSESEARLSDQKAYKDLLSSKKLDRRPRKKKLFCASCSEYHSYCSFSITAQREPSERRQCLVHEGVLWMCPFQMWTSAQIAAFKNKDGTWNMPSQSMSLSSPCPCMQHFTAYGQGYIIQIFPLGTFDQQNSISFRKIKLLLRSCHLRICPHSSLSDAKFLEAFDASCMRTFHNRTRDCECRLHHGAYEPQEIYCHMCHMIVFFRRQLETDGSITLYLLLNAFIPENQDTHLIDEFPRILTLPSEIQRRTEEWNTYSLYPDDAPIPRDQILAPNRNPYNRSTFCFN